MALPVRLLIRTISPPSHEPHQLHKDDVKLAAVQADGVERARIRATWPWWSAPQMLMQVSNPRFRNLLRW